MVCAELSRPSLQQTFKCRGAFDPALGRRRKRGRGRGREEEEEKKGGRKGKGEEVKKRVKRRKEEEEEEEKREEGGEEEEEKGEGGEGRKINPHAALRPGGCLARGASLTFPEPQRFSPSGSDGGLWGLAETVRLP